MSNSVILVSERESCIKMLTTLKQTAAGALKSEIVKGHFVVSSFTRLHVAGLCSKADTRDKNLSTNCHLTDTGGT